MLLVEQILSFKELTSTFTENGGKLVELLPLKT